MDERDEIMNEIRELGKKKREIEEKIDELMMQLATVAAVKHGLGKGTADGGDDPS